MSIYISVYTVAIPVNYISEFREIFEATAYKPTNCIFLVFFFPLENIVNCYQ